MSRISRRTKLNNKKKQVDEIWNFSHQQPSCQKQHVEDVTVCITYDTESTHFHINRYELCQSSFSWQGLRWSQNVSVVPSIYTSVQRKKIQEDNKFFFDNYEFPFLNAYGAKTVMMATCIKRRVNVLKFDPLPILLILKQLILWEQPYRP